MARTGPNSHGPAGASAGQLGDWATCISSDCCRRRRKVEQWTHPSVGRRALAMAIYDYIEVCVSVNSTYIDEFPDMVWSAFDN